VLAYIRSVWRCGRKDKCVLTVYAIVLDVEHGLDSRAPRERPEPGDRVAAAHASTDVRPDTNVVWEFLVFDSHLLAVWATQQSSGCACSSQHGVVALHFPAFDGGHVQSERPECAAQQYSLREEYERVQHDLDEEER